MRVITLNTDQSLDEPHIKSITSTPRQTKFASNTKHHTKKGQNRPLGREEMQKSDEGSPDVMANEDIRKSNMTYQTFDNDRADDSLNFDK